MGPVHHSRSDASDSPDDSVIRFGVHVHPGSRRRHVGGSYDGALTVHVTARATGGAATNETRRMIAEAFGVRHAAVSCERGARSRTKVMSVAGDARLLGARLAELLAGG